MKRWILKLLFLLLIVLIPLLYNNLIGEEETTKPTEQDYLHLLQGATEIKADSDGIYTGYDEEGDIVGYATDGKTLGITPTGYGGPITLIVAINPDGELLGLTIYGHYETSSYLRKIIGSETYQTLKGKSVEDEFLIGEDVDGITHATLSWKAILDGTREISRVLAEKRLGYEFEGEIEEETGKRKKYTYISILSIFLLGIIVLAVKFNEKKLPRLISLFLFSILLIFIIGSFLSTQSGGYLILGKPQSFSSAPYFYLLFGFLLISTPLLGRLYCGYVCPLGLLQELVHLLFPAKSWLSEKWDDAGGVLKYVIFVVVVFSILHSDSIDPAGYEPFSLFTLTTPAVIVVVLFSITIIASFFYPFFYCRYLCGVGAVSSCLSTNIVAGLRVGERCDGCGGCVDVCPVNAITIKDGVASLDNSICILCGRCVRECDNGAVGFGLSKGR